MNIKSLADKHTGFILFLRVFDIRKSLYTGDTGCIRWLQLLCSRKAGISICMAILLAVMMYQPALAQNEVLAAYFGFDPLEIIVVDDDFGPVAIADLNNDKLMDFVVINNRKSRIEFYYQVVSGQENNKKETADKLKVNELEPHWRYRKEELSIPHRVSAIVVHDFNGDGLPDLIYAGQPAELVLMGQVKAGVFEIVGRRKVNGLSANKYGLKVADLIGDARPELVVIVDETVHMYPINNNYLADPVILETGDSLAKIICKDINGDGLTDLLGVRHESSVPVRLWLKQATSAGVGLGPEIRFEMPGLTEIEPFTVPGQAGTKLFTIERSTERLVLYELSRANARSGTDHNAPMKVYNYPNSSGDKHDLKIADVDGNGLVDIVATDPNGNGILVYYQEKGRGITGVKDYPTFAEPASIAIGNVDNDRAAELFVMSVEESIVGTSKFTSATGYKFPTPLAVENDLVLLDLVELEKPTLAVISKDKRKHNLRLFDVGVDGSAYQDVSLDSLTRSPDAIMAIDADQDNLTDLLLFTTGAPMLMVKQEKAGEFKVYTKDDMAQYGLVSAASGNNTALMDIDGNGHKELLVADRNYVRALRYEVEPDDKGANPGWQVVEQFNTADARSKLISMTLYDGKIIVGDSENNRLLVLNRINGAWEELDSYYVEGYSMSKIYGGSFDGMGSKGVLCAGATGFSIVSFEGNRYIMDEIVAWRNDEEDRYEHEAASGDINGDGFVDFAVLDAGEQMLEIFTMSRAGRFIYAADFEIYQSKLFSGDDSREYEPREIFIADVTGDNADDVILLIHDRLLIYPQKTDK